MYTYPKSTKFTRTCTLQVGSILVHPKHAVIGRGYNRMPIHEGQELDFPWASQDGIKISLDSKDHYGKKLNDHTTSTHCNWPIPVVHSAIATIIDATEKWTKDDIKGSTLYTTLFPGSRNTQLLVEYGITTVVFIDDIYKHKPFTKASKKIIKKAGITIRYQILLYCDQSYLYDIQETG